MTRRREITEDGYLTCSRCKKSKHITEFYTRPEGVYVCIQDDEGIDCWYGKPMSWCAQCVKDVRNGIPLGVDDLAEIEKIDPLIGAS